MEAQQDDKGVPEPGGDEKKEAAAGAAGATPQLAADARKVYAAVTRGLRRGSTQFGVTVNQILCCLSFQPDWAADVVEVCYNISWLVN